MASVIIMFFSKCVIKAVINNNAPNQTIILVKPLVTLTV